MTAASRRRGPTRPLEAELAGYDRARVVALGGMARMMLGRLHAPRQRRRRRRGFGAPGGSRLKNRALVPLNGV
jgi:hypothetical protein